MYHKYKGEELKFKFIHDVDQKTSYCIVTKVSDDSEVGRGISKVHPNDTYNKAEGRYRTFGRALQSFVPKADRLEFWQAYQNWKTTNSRLVLSSDK